MITVRKLDFYGLIVLLIIFGPLGVVTATRYVLTQWDSRPDGKSSVCRNARFVHQPDWDFSEQECSIRREARGVFSKIVVLRVETLTRRKFLYDLNREIPNAKIALVRDAVVCIHPTKEGANFHIWEGGKAVFGTALQPEYQYPSKSRTDDVLLWHMSRVRAL